MESQLNLFKLLENTFPEQLLQNNFSPWQVPKKRKGMWVEAIMEFILHLSILDTQQNNLISLHK